MIERAKLQKFMEHVSSTMPSDTGSQAGYEKGANDLYAARHILFKFPDAATPAAKDFGPPQGGIRARADHAPRTSARWPSSTATILAPRSEAVSSAFSRAG
jgi:hypothetical protein